MSEALAAWHTEMRRGSAWIQAGFSRAWWRSLSMAERQQFAAQLSDDEVEDFLRDWRVWARDDQLPPPPGWKSWTILTGRGWGKTKTAVEACRDMVERGEKGRLCLLGQGEDDVRDVMIEGQSGFLATARSDFRPRWSPSRGGGLLEWPNGALGYVYSAEDPEALRGPEFDMAWIDEIMAFKAESRAKAESNLRFGLRLPPNPCRIYTTTPRPHRWLRDHLARVNPAKGIYLTRGHTEDNAENLAETFLESIREDYAGTRLGRQELAGEILNDSDNALWTSETLDACRQKLPELEDDIQAWSRRLERIIVAVDPNVSATNTSHAAGITVIGRLNGKRFLLADRTKKGGPDAWAEATVQAFDDYKAEYVLAETNQGGDLVRKVIQGEAQEQGRGDIAVRTVHAARGKSKRAEPVAAAYERGKVIHVGPAERYGTLESQMIALHEGHDETGEDFDRCDSLVWGMTDLARGLGSDSSASAGGGVILSFADYAAMGAEP